jgi:hypothetical protein
MPSAPGAFGVSAHRSSKRRDPLGMESWLYHTSLPPVKLALARQQTFPEQPSSARKCPAFGEVLVVSHEHVTDKIRTINKKDVLPAESHVRDVTELASHLFQEGERIFAEPQKRAAGKDLFRTGRKPSHESLGRRVLRSQREHTRGKQGQLRLPEGNVNRAGIVSSVMEYISG